ncbi:sigma-70 family RNA polymerase sigma factor [Cellulomonas gilvus]|uniref:RNA polymerase, sigma-24 subunit, ECF subfamily n=1 Tax=Cellulomonas gilvus (strain ATCC 13127 / NRRL B-14078) TaxID=593907 RepID=F8A5W2_CELGA|nr:sigma-70 family RNA polymerase sigma factor [Cellulomonas gilvus]AEI13402.1 RNA polymerase, sigma-24 subunit, ECF subfamily [Cellulomonas gilvus ATCC 13127]
MDAATVARSDAELIAAVRAGDPTGFAALYERHASAATTVARQYTNDPADADDVVSDAFAAVYGALQRGNGPDEAFRAYLFTVVRRTAAVRREGARKVTPTDDLATLEAGTALAGTAEEPTLAGFERGVVARAFHSLPERWQAVLWHTEVEELTPAEIAPILGLTANGVAALAYRAREGLRQAYLQQHLRDPLEPGCQGVAGSLGAYVRGGLGTRETGKVEAHLEGCGECRALLLELGDVNHGMRAVIAPLVLGLAGLGAFAGLLPAGGVAVGAAAAVAAGSGAVTGGTAGSGAATGGAAREGGAGAAGSGAAGAAGGAGGAAAGGGAIAGLLSGVPAVVVAAVAGAVIVAAVAVSMAIGMNGGGRDPEAGPGVLPTGTATPVPVVTPGGPSAPSSTAPSSDPSTAPSDVPGATDPDPTSDPTDAPTSVPTSDPTTPPPTGEPTTEPTAEPTGEPTTEPTGEPTTEPTDPPDDPTLTIDLPPDGLVLAGGAAGQDLSLTVRNDGGQAAVQLVAEVTLPEGVVVDSAQGTAPTTVLAGPSWSGPFAATALVAPRMFAAADDWTCVVPSPQLARCTLASLPARDAARLTVQVSIDETFDADAAQVGLAVTGLGIEYRPPPIGIDVTPSPARLALDPAQEPVALVARRERTATFLLHNAGRAQAERPQARLTLPAGVTWTGDVVAPWTCRAEGPDVLACERDGMGGRQAVPLTVGLTATSDDAADVRLELAPVRSPYSSSARVAVGVRQPATLAVDGPATVTVAGGRTSSFGLTVANTGDLDAEAAALVVQLPTGLDWVPDSGTGDWRCAADLRPQPTSPQTVRCDGPRLAAGAAASLTLAVQARAGAVGDAGSLVAAASAHDADLGTWTAAVRGTAPVLTVTDAAVGLRADDAGEVVFAVRVQGGADAADAADVVATVDLPGNLLVTARPDAPVPAACEVRYADVTCRWPHVAAGEVVEVLLPVRSTWSSPTTVTVTARAAGAQDAVGHADVPSRSGVLAERFTTHTGGWDVTEAGAPVLTCDAKLAACVRAQAGLADNNSQKMLPLDEAPPAAGTLRAKVPVSSTTTLTVPQGREIAFAGLYWSAVRGGTDTWSGPLDQALLRGPGGAYVPVRGETAERSDASGRRYYTSFADVTAQVRERGAGAWSLADSAVSATRNDNDPTYYGGWSLVVVYAAPGDARVTVYDGGLWVGTATPPPAFRFSTPAGSTARIGVVGWEGDRGLSGDRLRLGGLCTDATTDLVPLRSDGTRGSAGNAFDSSAVGWRTSSSLGIDAKGFAPTTIGCDVSSLTPVTTGDQYLVGAITLRTQPAG